MGEMAVSDTNPHLMTMATLTGHAVLAMGPYSIIMDNGAARADKTAQAMQEAGDRVGDMFEISTDKSGEFVAILQANSAPSTRTPRGHQVPGAFLQQVSGLDKHQLSSAKPLKYSHMDIAGSAGNLPDPTTGAPVAALTKWILS